MTACGYLWGVPAPTRIAPAAVPAIADWCRARRLRRPMLVGSDSLTAAPQGIGVVHALEAQGLAVWAFDRATSPSLVTVADAVAGYHFEDCDSVIAVGGAVALEVAKATALMVGQRNPYRLLAAEPGDDGEPVDASGIPPLLAVPATPAAAIATGGAVWIADDAGAARPLRHPALRPGEAVLAEDLVAAVPAEARGRSAAVAALIAADAGAAVAGATELDVLLAADDNPGEAMRAALRLSAAVEGASGPRRRLALTAAVAGGGNFAAMMAALAEPADWSATDWSVTVRERLRHGSGSERPDARVVRAAREACRPGDAEVLDRVLESLGLDFGGSLPRRRGRRGRVA